LGEIVFGDDRRGKIPPRGKDNIVVSYRTGGGKRGNVSAEEIDTLVDSIAYIDSVSNPVHASGGADLQSIDTLMEMAPKRLKHRDRATSKEDYFYLIREASSDVAKVSVEASGGRVQIAIVPFASQPKPLPSKGLLATVQKKLEVSAPATARVEVNAPHYVSLDLHIDIKLLDWNYATEMKSIINQKLETFLHPLYGGNDQQGWAFGTLPQLSEIYALFTDVEGIAFIAFLDITLVDDTALSGGNYSINDQTMPSLAYNMLICNGKHTIHFNEGEY